MAPVATNNPYRQFMATSSPPPTSPEVEDILATGPERAAPPITTPPETTSNPKPAQSKPKSPSSPPARDAVRTRSLGGSFGFIFDREIDLSPPTDDEIIIATIKYTPSFRRSSVQENAPLPSRPPARGFLRRMSTRWNAGENAAGAEGSGGAKFTALKMPRRDYKMYFARDREGKYVGSEPEREWSREELEEKYARFQDMPLRSVPGAEEYGEDYSGESRRGSVKQ